MKTFDEWIALREQGAGGPGSGVGGAAPTGPGGPGGIAPAQSPPGAIPQTPNQTGQPGQPGAATPVAPNPADAPDWTDANAYMNFNKKPPNPLPNQIEFFKQELDKYLQATHQKDAEDFGRIGTVGGKIVITPQGQPGEEVNPFQWAEIEKAGMILAGQQQAT